MPRSRHPSHKKKPAQKSCSVPLEKQQKKSNRSQSPSATCTPARKPLKPKRAAAAAAAAGERESVQRFVHPDLSISSYSRAPRCLPIEQARCTYTRLYAELPQIADFAISPLFRDCAISRSFTHSRLSRWSRLNWRFRLAGRAVQGNYCGRCSSSSSASLEPFSLQRHCDGAAAGISWILLLPPRELLCRGLSGLTAPAG